MVGRQAFPIGFWPLFRGELFSTREGRVKQCFLSKNWLIWLHCGRIGWIHGHTESWRWWNCCTFLDGRFWLDQWTNGICLESNRIMIQMNERATLRGLWCYFWKWITIFWNSLGHSPQKCFFVVAFQIVGQNLESQKTVSFHNHHPPQTKQRKLMRIWCTEIQLFRPYWKVRLQTKITGVWSGGTQPKFVLASHRDENDEAVGVMEEESPTFFEWWG